MLLYWWAYSYICVSDHPGWRQWRWEDISTGSVRPGKVHPWLLLSHRGHRIHSKYSLALPAPEPLYVSQGASQKEVGAYMRPREESHLTDYVQRCRQVDADWTGLGFDPGRCGGLHTVLL